jgi:hypothetical protein
MTDLVFHGNMLMLGHKVLWFPLQDEKHSDVCEGNFENTVAQPGEFGVPFIFYVPKALTMQFLRTSRLGKRPLTTLADEFLDYDFRDP